MTAIEELLERHQQQDRATSDTPAPPALHVVILTCMDARINPAEVFGLGHGEAHVLRNAGGVVTDDVIRSIALSQHALGTTEVIVMQHTSCGVSTVTEDGFKDQLEESCGLRPTWSVEAFRDVTASVRTSVQRVKRSPYLPHTDNVRGFVYDIRTGDVTEVE